MSDLERKVDCRAFSGNGPPISSLSGNEELSEGVGLNREELTSLLRRSVLEALISGRIRFPLSVRLSRDEIEPPPTVVSRREREEVV